MAIAYTWLCSGCGASNAAGLDVCGNCGINAVTSAQQIEQHRDGTATTASSPLKLPPLRQPWKSVAAVGITVAVAGAVIERFTFPTMSIWYVSVALMVGGVVVCGVVYAAHKRATNDT
jgi:hypothetical protein